MSEMLVDVIWKDGRKEKISLYDGYADRPPVFLKVRVLRPFPIGNLLEDILSSISSDTKTFQQDGANVLVYREL